MPNFDGTGTLKRGRIIGRGLGPAKNAVTDASARQTLTVFRVKKNLLFE
jgi:hypothetical protein